MQQAWGHTARQQVKSLSAQVWGSALIGVEGGSLEFQDHSLSMNLKQERENLSLRKRKTSGPTGQLWKSTKISKTKEPQCGRQLSSLSSYVAGRVFIRDSWL